MTTYEEYINSKRIVAQPVGIRGIKASDLNPALFDFQAAVVAYCLRRGRAAIWGHTGTGKSFMETSWCSEVSNYTEKPSLILTHIGIIREIVRAGGMLGIPVNRCEKQSDVHEGVNVTNYDKLHKFDPSQFGGIAADESGALKDYTASTTKGVIDFAQSIYFRLDASATPAPNDVMEIGTHAEFLGIMSRPEMLATFFTHDGGETSKWMLKPHGEDAFWRWVASWAIAFRSPADLGFDGSRYILPKLHWHEVIIDHPETDRYTGELFGGGALSLTDQRKTKRESIDVRVEKIAEIVATEPEESFIVWGDLNDECDLIEKSITGMTQIAGRHSDDFKEKAIGDFAEGRLQRIVTKFSMFSMGVNLQICARMVFCDASHSFECVYQAVRRCWRFGQKREVHAWMVLTDAHKSVLANYKRKEADAERMMAQMIKYMSVYSDLQEDESADRDMVKYDPKERMVIPNWLFSKQ